MGGILHQLPNMTFLDRLLNPQQVTSVEQPFIFLSFNGWIPAWGRDPREALWMQPVSCSQLGFHSHRLRIPEFELPVSTSALRASFVHFSLYVLTAKARSSQYKPCVINRTQSTNCLQLTSNRYIFSLLGCIWLSRRVMNQQKRLSSLEFFQLV